MNDTFATTYQAGVYEFDGSQWKRTGPLPERDYLEDFRKEALAKDGNLEGYLGRV